MKVCKGLFFLAVAAATGLIPFASDSDAQQRGGYCPRNYNTITITKQTQQTQMYLQVQQQQSETRIQTQQQQTNLIEQWQRVQRAEPGRDRHVLDRVCRTG